MQDNLSYECNKAFHSLTFRVKISFKDTPGVSFSVCDLLSSGYSVSTAKRVFFLLRTGVLYFSKKPYKKFGMRGLGVYIY
jgi:hypothetical protein